MAQHILIAMDSGYSRLHRGARLFTITWIDTETLEICRTQIDDSMENYRASGWNEIVTQFDSSQPRRDIYTNLKRTSRVDRNQDRIITGDSRPRYWGTADMDLIQQHVQERLASLVSVRE